MKKLIALLLALSLCLTMTGFAFAETAEETTEETAGDTADQIPELENEVAFEAQDVAIGASGYTMKVPADWTAAASEDGTTLSYTSADGTMTLTLAVTAVDLDGVFTQCDAAVTEGKAKSVTEAYINGVYFILLDVDDLTAAAYTYLDDTQSLLMQFVVTDASVATANQETVQQILGSVTAPETADAGEETAEEGAEEATDGE